MDPKNRLNVDESQVNQRIGQVRARRPRLTEDHVTLAHGAGGKASAALLDAVFLEGYGNAVLDADKTWGFVFDLGIMLQGSPDVGLASSGPLANDPTFKADLAKEEKDIQDDADVFRIYPVLAFGISYQF